MNEVLVTPSKMEQKVAKQVLMKLETCHDDQSKIFVSIGGTRVLMPARVVRYLKLMMMNMAEGKGFELILDGDQDEELSTQQAADRLKVSRPYFIKLLEQGSIPFSKVGKHRRVKLKDLLVYETKQAELREQQLKLLATQAQEIGLGY